MRLIYHGRQVCTARAPRCEACIFAGWCPSSRFRSAGAAASCAITGASAGPGGPVAVPQQLARDRVGRHPFVAVVLADVDTDLALRGDRGEHGLVERQARTCVDRDLIDHADQCVGAGCPARPPRGSLGRHAARASSPGSMPPETGCQSGGCLPGAFGACSSRTRAPAGAASDEPAFDRRSDHLCSACARGTTVGPHGERRVTGRASGAGRPSGSAQRRGAWRWPR